MDLAISATSGEPAHGLEAAASRMLDMIGEDGMLSPLVGSPDHVMLGTWLAHETSMRPGVEEEDIPAGFDLFR
jgi:hypothetical protein